MAEPPDRPKFRTFIHDAPDLNELGEVEPYRTPNDVPVSLRHTLRQAHESGLTPKHLAEIFELPVEWIALFVKDPKGQA